MSKKIIPPFWNPGYFRLFVTHISKSKASAASLQQALAYHQIHAFVAHKDIEPTKEWEGEIISALNTADALIALMHKGFHSSKWTDQEIGIALGRGLLVVPITFGETPYGFIGRFQAVQGKGKSWIDLSRELFGIFLNREQTKRRVSEVLLEKFASSGSFDQAKSNMSILEKVKYWDSGLSQRARTAIQENDQLSAAWSVPNRLEALIGKWAK
jgi:hypothetical protein